MGDGPLVLDPTTETAFIGTSFRPYFAALDTRTGEPRAGFAGLNGSAIAGVFPLGAGHVGTYAKDDTEVKLWTVATGTSSGRVPVPALPAGGGQARDVSVWLSPNGRYIAAGRNGNPVPVNPVVPFLLADTTTGKTLLTSGWKGGAVRFTADSGRALVATYDGLFQWFRLPSGELEGGWDFRDRLPVGWHIPGGMSADGRVFGYSGHGPPTTPRQPFVPRLLNGTTGADLWVFGGRTTREREYDEFVAPEVSADGRLAVLKRNSVQGQRANGLVILDVVDTAAGAVLSRVAYKGFNKPVFDLAPDGKSLAVYNTGDNAIYFFDVPAAR
jgi:hypothetical protein